MSPVMFRRGFIDHHGLDADAFMRCCCFLREAAMRSLNCGRHVQPFIFLVNELIVAVQVTHVFVSFSTFAPFNTTAYRFGCPMFCFFL